MKYFLTGCMLVLFSYAYAQYPLAKGQKQLNAGLGFSSWGLPVYVGLDVGVHKDVSVGGEFSFRSYNENFRGIEYSHSIVGVAANGNYHFNSLLSIPKDFDFYGGLNLGFYSWGGTAGYPGTTHSGLGLGAQVGGRYYFNSKVGLNLELGGGSVSGGKFGISVKF